MSLLTQVNERSDGNFYFQQSGGANAITSFTGAGIIGTMTSAGGIFSHVFPYTFQAGTYYVQALVELDVVASASGDVLTCYLAQEGLLNTDIVVSTFNGSGYSAGSVGRLMLTGYIKTQPSTSGLSWVVQSNGIGANSIYQIKSPTNSFIFIQKVA